MMSPSKMKRISKPPDKNADSHPTILLMTSNFRIDIFLVPFQKTPPWHPFFNLLLVPLPLTRPNNPPKNCENGSLAGNRSHQIMLWKKDFPMSTFGSMWVFEGICLFVWRLFFFNLFNQTQYINIYTVISLHSIKFAVGQTFHTKCPNTNEFDKTVFFPNSASVQGINSKRTAPTKSMANLWSGTQTPIQNASAPRQVRVQECA